MTRRAFLEKYFVRFAVSLTLVGLIVYTVYHVFGASSGSLLTTPTRRITDVEIIDGEGYLFREEKVLTVSSPGIIRDLAKSGSKVSRGGALVQVYQGYDTEDLASAQLALERLEGMIAVLEESRVADGTTLAKAEAYRKDAVAAYRSICAASARGEIAGISALAERMLVLLNRHASLTDPNFDTEEALQSIGTGEALVSFLDEKGAPSVVEKAKILFHTVYHTFFYKTIFFLVQKQKGAAILIHTTAPFD